MTEEQDQIVQIIASQLFGKQYQFPNEISWKAILLEAHKQAVYPFVYELVKEKIPEYEEKEQFEKIDLAIRASGILD